MRTFVLRALIVVSIAAVFDRAVFGYGRGLGGGTRPNISRPATAAPSRPQDSIARPSARPVSPPASRPSVNLPNVPVRPNNSMRPNIPSKPQGGLRPSIGTGGAQPSKLPAQIENHQRPSLPSTSVPRPGKLPANNLPGRLPDRPEISTQPGQVQANRPSPGDVSDFLGMDRPSRPTTLPGVANRPGISGRPSLSERDGWGNNPVIHKRPAWVNIDKSTNINIHQRWNNSFTRPTTKDWWNRSPNRLGYWHGWADGVRHHWSPYHHHHGWFQDDWWGHHHCSLGGWHYHHWHHQHPWRYWWTAPAWNSLTTWFVWNAPTTVWTVPVYYDYGQGGNVVYENNTVYIGGDQIATADEFAQSAMDLATVTPPESDEVAAQTEWLPLGTFAISTGEAETEPNRIIQLAVNKSGIIGGTLFNIETDEPQAVQGQVDRETQRVALRLGESETVVAETGLYNLTQEEAPLLIHFGTEQTENWLLIRLPEPAEESIEETAPDR